MDRMLGFWGGVTCHEAAVFRSTHLVHRISSHIHAVLILARQAWLLLLLLLLLLGPGDGGLKTPTSTRSLLAVRDDVWSLPIE